MNDKSKKKSRLRGPKKPSELFLSPYAEQLRELYAAQNFKGRPPESSVKLLGVLIKAGHFPWLNGPAPEWVTSLIDGGPAYQQYLQDTQDELKKSKQSHLEMAARSAGTSKSEAGKQSGDARRTAAKRGTDAIATNYQKATKTAGKKPDAFAVATWHIQQTSPSLGEAEKKRLIRNLTKRLRGLDSAI